MLPVEPVCGLKPCGLFRAERKYDIHTGLDIYTKPDAEVVCINKGVVLSVFQFTGEAVGSPWWNDTWAVAVASHDLVYVYGEVIPCVKVGEIVSVGRVLGTIAPVLKKDKGVTPTSMLHLEVWERDEYIEGYTCNHDTEPPYGLFNPIAFLDKEWKGHWVVKTPSGYKLEDNSGAFLKFFSMPADCKAYCLSNEILYKYLSKDVDAKSKVEYTIATGKTLWFETGETE